MRKKFVKHHNPFLEALKKGGKKEIEFISQSPGSPLYYSIYDNGEYSIAIIDENYEIQYFDDKAMKFLINMIYKGKQYRKAIQNKTKFQYRCRLCSSKFNL